MLHLYSISRPVNAQKRDRIPDPAFLGLKTPGSDWQDRAFDHLAEQCAYLIHTRGYEAWAL